MVAEPLDKKKGIPEFRPGDTVRVHIKVIEGESERIQTFEGTVISRRGSGESQSFTVRKISFGVGVERTFPLSSPHIDKIEVTKTGRVRRSRLYYLRNLTGRAARLSEEEVRGEAKPPASPDSSKPSAAAPTPAPKPEGQDGAHQAKVKPAEVKKQSEHGTEHRALGTAPAPK